MVSSRAMEGSWQYFPTTFPKYTSTGLRAFLSLPKIGELPRKPTYLYLESGAELECRTVGRRALLATSDSAEAIFQFNTTNEAAEGLVSALNSSATTDRFVSQLTSQGTMPAGAPQN